MAKTATVQKANQSARKAIGAATAALWFKTIAEQGTKLLGFLNTVFQMDTEEQAAFRIALGKGLEEERNRVNALKVARDQARTAGDADALTKAAKEYDIANRSFNSMKVRTSEASRFAEACEAGYNGFNIGQGYHRAIAEARVFLQSKGAGKNSGRAAKTPEQRIRTVCQQMIEEGRLDAEGLKTVLSGILKDMKGWKVNEEKAAKAKADDNVNSGAAVQGTMDQVRHVGPTQRTERRKNAGSRKQMKAAGIDTDRRTHEAPASVQ